MKRLSYKVRLVELKGMDILLRFNSPIIFQAGVEGTTVTVVQGIVDVSRNAFIGWNTQVFPLLLYVRTLRASCAQVKSTPEPAV